MSFSFKPLSDSEILNRNLLDSGIYEFEIISATQGNSKKGNSMITLMLKIEKEGTYHIIYDYLVSIDSMMYKIKNFCDSVGLISKYELGKLTPEDCIDKRGSAKIEIDPERVNPNSPDGMPYPSKNVVRKYLKRFDALQNDEIKIVAANPETLPVEDLDIPF